MNTWQYPDTNGWAEFPFDVKGLPFVSKIDPAGEMYFQVKKLPRPILDAMNTDAINSLIGNVSEMSMTDIVEKLADINNGATQAVIELA